MRKLALLLLILISPALALTNESVNAVKKVFILNTSNFSSTNEITKGIIQGLAEKGFYRGVNLDVRIESANANPMVASEIASVFMTQHPDVVVGIGTMAAQSFVNYARADKVKLVFCAITDPVGAGLIKSTDTPEHDISGTTDFVDPKLKVDLIKRLQPKLQNLGVIYNPEESNSITIVKRLDEICPKLGINLIKQTVASISEVNSSAVNLAGQVEAILVDNDNTALTKLNDIIRTANIYKIPVYVSSTHLVSEGAIAGLGSNAFQTALQTSNIIARTLKGEDLRNIQMEHPTQTELYINLDVSKALGIAIPKDIKAQAAQIIGSN